MPCVKLNHGRRRGIEAYTTMNTTHLLLFAAFGSGEFVVMLLSALLFGLGAFWIWMLVDCATNENEPGSKVTWILIILFASLVGAPIYYFARKVPRDRPSQCVSNNVVVFDLFGIVRINVGWRPVSSSS